MIKKSQHPDRNIEDYRQFLPEEDFLAMERQASQFRGKKVVHLNATPIGGGVAEILKSLVPLQRSMGIDSEWYHLEGDSRLFEITKTLHNSLQGADVQLSDSDKEYYLDFNRRLADYAQALKPDILVIHDPQPLAVISYLKNIPVYCRIHIDLTQPNQDSINFIKPFLNQYRRVVFSSPEYVPDNFTFGKAAVSMPAIDPLSDKNSDVFLESRTIFMERFGLDPMKRLVVQVARFDPWKDPVGVMQAFSQAKAKIPDCQLVLSGVIEAQDDPEAFKIIEEVKQEAVKHEDVRLFYSMDQLNGTPIDVFVSNLQASADVIFQKSTREGFGMSVTEAMWKSKPVVAGNVGGLKLQITDGLNGFLVNTVDEAAERLLQLLGDKALCQSMGQEAHEKVKNNFLITRLLNNELEIMASLVSEAVLD